MSIITREELERGEALFRNSRIGCSEDARLLWAEWRAQHIKALLATARAYHDELEAPQKASEEHG
jgi:hypothetical protein